MLQARNLPRTKKKIRKIIANIVLSQIAVAIYMFHDVDIFYRLPYTLIKVHAV